MYSSKKKTEVSQSLILNKNKNKKYKVKLILVGLLILMIILSLFTGVYDIQKKQNGAEIFFISRVSRTAAIVLTAVAMSICGMVMQIVSKNKFVEPTTTGTMEWTGLGLIATNYFITSPTIFQRMIGSIVFSFIGTIIFFSIVRNIKLKSSFVVPILGIMLGAVTSSVSTFIALTLNMSQVLSVWFSGSFAMVESGRYELLWLVAFVVVAIYLFADKLTIVGLGEDISTNLGLSYNKYILISTAMISITLGIVSSVIGYIPFLGMIVPNIVSRYKGDNLKTNLPFVAILGPIILLACDIISRVVIMPFEVPVSLTMGTAGAAVFIFLILSKRRKNEL